MPGPLYVLLPPSEAKASGGGAPLGPGAFDDDLGSARADVVDALARVVRRASRTTLTRLLGVRGELLARARDAVEALGRGDAPTLPAWRRYRGVVWAHLEPETLDAPSRRRLIVPSGLYGLTGGDDAIADYRLKMNVTLPGVGHLASFWRARISPVLGEAVRGATVVDLLPREHAAALDAEVLGAATDVVRVAFVSSQGDAAVGHAAKAVKGVFARRLLVEGPGALDEFSWRGWRLDRADGAVRIVAPRESTTSPGRR